MRRLLVALITAAATSTALAGCGITGGAYDLPLPGGADVGDHPMTITAEFGDVLDLVPHSDVQLNNVAVGEVSSVTLAPDDRRAVVTLRIRGDLDLSADTTARLQQTSLLGEKYVALQPGSGAEPLAEGDRIEQAVTSRAVGAEEILGALSALLNGGGVAQFQTISRELRAVGAGRTDDVRAFLEELGTLVSRLDRRRTSVTDAIDGLHALGSALAANRDRIDQVLSDLPSGIEAISDQREGLVQMLEALDRLSGVTLDVLHRAGEDIAADLKTVAPVLDKLADTGQDLPRSLEMLLTFPFTDAVLDAVRGDYINLFVTLNLRSTGVIKQPSTRWPYPPATDPTARSLPLLFEDESDATLGDNSTSEGSS